MYFLLLWLLSGTLVVDVEYPEFLSEDYINNGINDDIFKEQKNTKQTNNKILTNKTKTQKKEKKEKQTKGEWILCPKEDERATKL